MSDLPASGIAGLRVRVQSLLPYVSPLLLCLIAVAQLRLTRTESLTPWKGGGFGMFSTNDPGPYRQIGIRIYGTWGERDIPIPATLSDETYRRALYMPSRRHLEKFAQEVASSEAARGIPVSEVRIAIWRMSYDPGTLLPSLEVVRDMIVEVPPLRRQS